MNNRIQPNINNNLKDLGKFDLNKVNQANHSQGQMEFDVSIKDTSKEEQNRKRIIKTAIISSMFIILAFIFAFTDLKYLIFPKKQIKVVEENFEDVNVIHELKCNTVQKNSGMEIEIEDVYYYNNNKLKKVISSYKLVFIDSQIKDDESLFEYVNSSFNKIINTYDSYDGIDFEYNVINTSAHNFKQVIDFTKLDQSKDISSLTTLYLDEKIDYIKKINSNSGIICE